MVSLQWSRTAAIPTNVLIVGDELHPFGAGEMTFCLSTARAIAMVLRPQKIRVLGVVGSDARLLSLRVTGIQSALVFTVSLPT